MEFEKVTNAHVETLIFRENENAISYESISNLVMGSALIGLALELKNHEEIDPVSMGVIGTILAVGIFLGSIPNFTAPHEA